jgi:hypothetical protein
VNTARFFENSTEPNPLLKALKKFVDWGFRSPLVTFQYLQKRGKCGGCESLCTEVVKHISRSKLSLNPWEEHEAFFQWCFYTPSGGVGWSRRRYGYEWPIRAIFLNSLIAQFLASKGLDEITLRESFRAEFTGIYRDKEIERLIPPCLLKKEASDSTGTGKIYGGRTLYYDFSLKGIFPTTVGEVKVVDPKKSVKFNFNKFKEDLDKCEGWLMPETPFEYGVAILIDLTRGSEYRNAWGSEIDVISWAQKNILPWFISPLSS